MSKARLFKQIDSLFGPLLCRLFARPQRTVDYPALDEVEGPLLVIRPGGIGDAVLLLPLLAALRETFSGREIDLLCEARNRAVAGLAFPEVHTMCYDVEPFGVLRRLRQRGYAAVFDSEQYHHFSGILAAWSRAPLRVGFKINARRNALYTHLVSYDLDGPEEQQFGRLLAALCGRVPTLPPKEGILAGVALAKKTLHGLDHATSYAVIHTGSSVAAKQWPAARYAGLCERLTNELGLKLVLVGGMEDREFAASVSRVAACKMIDLTGKLSLEEVAALSRDATIFIGPDSGIAHLATAVGASAVVLFGPSDQAKWGPGKNGVAVRHPVPCGPCAIFGYNKPCLTFACMDRISIEQVFVAVRDLLDRQGKAD